MVLCVEVWLVQRRAAFLKTHSRKHRLTEDELYAQTEPNMKTGSALKLTFVSHQFSDQSRAAGHVQNLNLLTPPAEVGVEEVCSQMCWSVADQHHILLTVHVLVLRTHQ